MLFLPKQIKRIGAYAVMFACSLQGASAHAALTYEFVQLGTDDTLAYWTLSELPASYEEVVGLAFTPEGDTIFGLGGVYLGEFNIGVASQAFDDGVDGLEAGIHDNLFGGAVMDDSPPLTVHAPAGSIGGQFSLRYDDTPGHDQIWYTYYSSDAERFDFEVYGDWRLSSTSVPEPTSLVPVSVAAVTLSGRRRYRTSFTS